MTQELWTGRRIGTYQIQTLLGAGGMGEVYRAHDTRLGRDVAIKFLSQALTGNPDRLARFEREARLLAAVNHPNIATIHGLEESDGVCALVLELIEGETLADRLKRGALPVPEALAIARQIADALDAAHEKGIVHRDLKPANVKITPAGSVKVLDFGLAKVDAARESSVDLTNSPTIALDRTLDGFILGTAPYMSPEQARGLAIDKRTDIWAFGCVVYEMLTGLSSFARATTSDTIAAVLGDTPDWSRLPAGTPPILRRLLQRCLEKNARRRIRDIGDIQIELDDLAAGPTTAEPPALAGPQALRSNHLAWPLAAMSLAAAVLGIALARPLWSGATQTAPSFSRVTQLDHGTASESGAAISPDGKWVAYLSNARGPTDVWVRFLGAGDPVNLTASTTLNIQSRTDLAGLAISPDGASIAFDAGATRTTPAPQFDSWAIPAPLGGVPRKIVELGRGVRWSPDGTQILFVRAGSLAGDALFIARADGGSSRELVPVRGGMHLHWPAWSRDGRHIYFNYTSTTSNGEPAGIYRVAVAGGPIEPVVTSARRAVFPVPMPDGSGVIYSANPTSVDLALWWKPFDRPDPVRLTTGVGEYAETSIAPDGRTMISAVVQYRQALTEFPVSAGGAAPRPITDGSTGDFDPILSPGGDQLVFSSSRSGFRNIWTARPDGTMARALTSGNAFDERPAFSRDGRRLAFVSDRGGRRGIWTISADGGIPEQLVTADVIDRLVWAPDGRGVVFATTVNDQPALQIASVPAGAVQRVRTPGPAVGPFGFSEDIIGYLEPFPGGPGKPNINRVAFVRTSGEPAFQDALRSLGLANGFAVLSADGRRLAGVVDPGGAAGSIWVAELGKGTAFQKIADLPPDVRPRGGAWMPGNDTLIVGTTQRTSHLVVFDQGK